MNTFFFIPASKSHKIKDILNLGVDHIIIDFEDSVLEKDRIAYFEEIKLNKNYKEFWYRIPVRSNFKNAINLNFLTLFTDNGINKFILPKLISSDELFYIDHSLTKNIICILLIEHPRFMFDLESILRNQMSMLKITGIGLGSHDLTSIMNTTNNERVLNYPKSYLSYISKAFNILNIDVASMEIKEFNKFSEEIELAKEFACDAKFLIHPIQLEWFKLISSVRNDEVEWATTIINSLPHNAEPDDIEPFILNGKIIEKMHILNALRTIKKYKDGK